MIFLNLFLATVIRFFNLSSRPFDGDEGIVILISQTPWKDLLSRVSQDVHPPLFHFFTKISLYLGNSEFFTRLFPVIFSIILVYATYIFTKKLFSKKIATTASLITAFSPYLIYFSQEIRMYALFALLFTLSYYFFYKIIFDKNSKKSDILFYTIFSVLGLYTQYLMGLVLIIQALYVVIFRCKKIKKYKNLLLAYLIIVILFIPQFSTFIDQFFSRVTEHSQSINFSENIKSLLGTFYRFGSGRIYLDISPSFLKSSIASFTIIPFLATLIVPVYLFFIGLKALYLQNKQTFWFLIFPMVITSIATIFVSQIGGQATRYLIFLFPIYAIFVSIAIYKNYSKLAFKILTIIFCIITFFGLFYHFDHDSLSPGSDKIANYICENHKSNELVLIRGGFGGGEKWVFEYYFSKKCSLDDIDVVDMFEEYETGNLDELYSIKPEDKIFKLLPNYDKIWFYDMTYNTEDISNSIKHKLGLDKENKELVIWEIEKGK